MEIVQQLQEEAMLLQSRGLLVKFYPKSVKDEVESKEKGYAVSKTVDYIEIRWDNDDSVVDRPVQHSEDEGDYWYLHSDIKKYPKQWNAYKAGQVESFIGIPIEHLFKNDPGKADNYKHGHIHTVEQLADTGDASLQRFMGGLADKALAVKYLAKARENFAADQRIEEMNNLREERDFMQAQMREMQMQMSKLVEEKLAAAKAEPVIENKNKKKKDEE